MAGDTKPRGRGTKTLLQLAWRKFYACEYCNRDFSYEFADDLLKRLRMTARERRRLARALTCPHCESPLDALDELAAYDRRQLAEIRRHEVWARQYAQELDDFESFLEEFPSLGASYPMGSELAKGVRRLSPTRVDPKVTWYRARRWKDGETLSANDMLPPDPHQVAIPPGRFNHAGQVGLYVAQFPSDTAVEVLDDPAQPAKLWIAEIEFEEPLRVLDLGIWVVGEQSRLPTVLEGLRQAVTRPRTRNDLAPREHHLGRFVGDLVRRRRLDGVVYTSSREYPFGPDVYGRNLIVVNFQKAKVVWGPTLHEWKRVTIGAPFDLPRMDFEPAIPVEWWAKLRERGRGAEM